MKKLQFSFKGAVRRFPGSGGGDFLAGPKKHTAVLKKKRVAWGMYPITAKLGKTEWKTKLMLMKSSDFFVALRADIRKKEAIAIGDRVTVSFTLN